MLIAFLSFILCLSTCEVIFPRTLLPSEVYRLMFTDLTDNKYMFPPDDDSEPPDAAVHSNLSLAELMSGAFRIGSYEDAWNSFKKPIKGPGGGDKKQFDDLNLEIYNTRRSDIYGDGIHYEYNEEWDYYSGRGFYDIYEDYYTVRGPESETAKISLMKGVPYQYLMLARDSIAGALKQRNKIRGDKRYQLGYMFCRVRRLKTEILKCVGTMEKQLDNTYEELDKKPVTMMSLYLYEAVVRMDVDVRDTIKYIREVHDKPADFDYDYEIVEEVLPQN